MAALVAWRRRGVERYRRIGVAGNERMAAAWRRAARVISMWRRGSSSGMARRDNVRLSGGNNRRRWLGVSK